MLLTQENNRLLKDGKMTKIPEGYELAEHSAAKDIAMESLEASLTKQGRDPYDDDYEIELIGLADDVVEALIKAGITIPEGLKSPFDR